MRTIALAIALIATGFIVGAVNNGMRSGAERARLANIEVERVVVTAERRDAQIAAASIVFTF
jgi:hypothetical protein